MLKSMEVEMHIIGWNNRGLIGFEHGGRYLSYINAPKEDSEEMKKIKDVYPYISPEMVRSVNEYQDAQKAAEFASSITKGGKKP